MDRKKAYEILGLTPGCSVEAAKKAYRDLAKKYHPDRVSDRYRLSAERQMKQINEAFRSILPGLKPENDTCKPDPGPLAGGPAEAGRQPPLNSLKDQILRKMNTIFKAGRPHRQERSSGRGGTRVNGGINRAAGDFDAILRKYTAQFSKAYAGDLPGRKAGRFRKTDTHQYRSYIQLQKRYTAAAKKRTRAKGSDPVGPITPVTGIDRVERS